MKTLNFGPAVGRHIDRHGSDFVMSRLIHTETLHIGCMRLEAGGLVGHHQAVTHQLFAVVEGEGWVHGEDGERVPIRAGQAALWAPGEYHGAGTESGMVAIVVEGDGVEAGPREVGPVPPMGENVSNSAHSDDTVS
jgi:mannose-6-phosphate isomerase-like protein (cupin superfamily)